MPTSAVQQSAQRHISSINHWLCNRRLDHARLVGHLRRIADSEHWKHREFGFRNNANLLLLSRVCISEMMLLGVCAVAPSVRIIEYNAR